MEMFLSCLHYLSLKLIESQAQHLVYVVPMLPLTSWSCCYLFLFSSSWYCFYSSTCLRIASSSSFFFNPSSRMCISSCSSFSCFSFSLFSHSYLFCSGSSFLLCYSCCRFLFLPISISTPKIYGFALDLRLCPSSRLWATLILYLMLTRLRSFDFLTSKVMFYIEDSCEIHACSPSVWGIDAL